MNTDFVVLCLVLCCAPALEAALKLPPFIKRCSRSDPKLNECALKSAQAVLPHLVKGDPKYKIMSIDPARVDRMAFGDNSEKPVGMGFIMENCTISGLGTMAFTKTRFDLKKLHVEVEGIIRKLVILGKYKVKGNILILPIKGEGNANFTVENVNFRNTMNYFLYKKKDGKDYFRTNDSKVNSTLGSVHVDLQNLFNGDKALGDNMNLILNENFREIETIFRPVIEQAIADLIAFVVNNILKDVPYDEIFLP